MFRIVKDGRERNRKHSTFASKILHFRSVPYAPFGTIRRRTGRHVLSSRAAFVNALIRRWDISRCSLRVIVIIPSVGNISYAAALIKFSRSLRAVKSYERSHDFDTLSSSSSSARNLFSRSNRERNSSS